MVERLSPPLSSVDLAGIACTNQPRLRLIHRYGSFGHAGGLASRFNVGHHFLMNWQLGRVLLAVSAIALLVAPEAEAKTKPQKKQYRVVKKKDTKTRAIQKRLHTIVIEPGMGEAEIVKALRSHYAILRKEIRRTGASYRGIWIWAFESERQIDLGDAGWIAMVQATGQKLPARPVVKIKDRRSKRKPTKQEVEIYRMNRRLLLRQPDRDEDSITAEIAKKFGLPAKEINRAIAKVTFSQMGRIKKIK